MKKLLTLVVMGQFVHHSWPTLYEALLGDISHKHASAYMPTSHPAHDVGSAQAILAVASND